MSDITIRLRTWPNAVDAVPAIDLMDEAANVIESLRAEIRTQRQEIARLRGDAEVARLRLEAAQGEIERLRSPSLIRDSAAQIERLLAEIARLRLTDEDREAIAEKIRAVTTPLADTQEPAAWAVMYRDWHCGSYFLSRRSADELADKLNELSKESVTVVPLYKQSQLSITHEERELLSACATEYESASRAMLERQRRDEACLLMKRSFAISGLLEKLGGKR